jgi:hypothetical protein
VANSTKSPDVARLAAALDDVLETTSWEGKGASLAPALLAALEARGVSLAPAPEHDTCYDALVDAEELLALIDRGVTPPRNLWDDHVKRVRAQIERLKVVPAAPPEGPNDVFPFRRGDRIQHPAGGPVYIVRGVGDGEAWAEREDGKSDGYGQFGTRVLNPVNWKRVATDPRDRLTVPPSGREK